MYARKPPSLPTMGLLWRPRQFHTKLSPYSTVVPRAVRATGRAKKPKNDICKDRRYPCLHMENSPLLRIENLVTAFPIKGNRTLTAVDGVDLSIPTGEIVGLVGESGSGKSVLAMSVMRLIDPPGIVVRGKVVFDGVDLLQLSEDDMRSEERRSIAMIFQNPSA